AEQNPRRLETVIRRLTGKRQFSLEHLYALLIHYKEPSEEFDDLEDDKRLWDLFDGNGSKSARKPRASKANGKSPSAPKRSGGARVRAAAKAKDKSGATKASS